MTGRWGRQPKHPPYWGARRRDALRSIFHNIAARVRGHARRHPRLTYWGVMAGIGIFALSMWALGFALQQHG